MRPDGTTSTPMRVSVPWRVFGLVVCIVALAVAMVWVEVPDLGTLREWSDRTGAWFPLLLWTLYVGITQFPIPRTLLTLASGVFFGPWGGIVVALSATTASAVLSLSIVRGLLGPWVVPRLTHPAVETVALRLRERGWLAVGSLRLIAGIPFSVVNYAAALTPIPLLPFALATLVGSAPGTIVVVVLGDSLTGEPDATMIAAMAGLALVGIAGVVLDQLMPVKSVR